MLLAIGIFVLVQAVITYQYILILRESNKYQDALDAPFGPITPLNIIPIILSSLISKEKNNRNKNNRQRRNKRGRHPFSAPFTFLFYHNCQLRPRVLYFSKRGKAHGKQGCRRHRRRKGHRQSHL